MSNLFYEKIPILSKDTPQKEEWFRQFMKDMEFYRENKGSDRKLKKLVKRVTDEIQAIRKQQDEYYYGKVKDDYDFFQTYDREISRFTLGKDCLQDYYDEYTGKKKSQLKKDPLYKQIPIAKYKNKITEFWLRVALALVKRGNAIHSKSLSITNKSTWVVKVLPKGSPMYHGSYNNMGVRPGSPANYNRKVIFTDIMWFAPNINIVLQYASGFVHTDEHQFKKGRFTDDKGRSVQDRWDVYVFKAKKDLRLLYINLETVKKLKRQFPFASPIIEETFPITDNKLGRNSSTWYDYIFSQFLCIYLGYDGYYSSAIGGLEPEIMICSPRNSLTEPQLYVWFAETIEGWIDAMKEDPDKSRRIVSPQDAQIFLELYTSTV